MTFLTIFTAPKPFTDPHINIIQRNAIQSWMHLSDEVEVILIGEEDGLSAVAAEFNLKHLPEVARNNWNTPLVSSIFDLARAASDSPVLAYINADILLMPDFVDVARQVVEGAEKFLVVGQRWDYDFTEPLVFSPNWDQRLRTIIQAGGVLHAPAGSDYFIFPRSVFANLPDFAIGRAGWDNWMIYHVLQNHWPVVDATKSLIVIHQNHDYSHLPGGKIHYDLEETKINAALGGGMRNMYITLDASHELIGGRVRVIQPSFLRVLRKLENWVHPTDQKGLRWVMTRYLRRLRRKISKG